MSKQLSCRADKEGNITIFLPANVIKHYVNVADYLEKATITDLPTFAKDLAHVLINDEQEDGTNHLHMALDSAFYQFSEGHQFSEGLDWDD